MSEFQENGTLRIVPLRSGGFKLVSKGLDGSVREPSSQLNSEAQKQIAQQEAAFSGFVLLEFWIAKRPYWCRIGQHEQFEIRAHDFVHAKEIAHAAGYDPSDAAAVAYGSLQLVTWEAATDAAST